MPATGRFPLPNGVFARALPETQNLSRVDAYNFTVQREISPSLSAEIAYVGNRGEGFFGDNPAADANAPTLVGFPDVPRDQRRPFARVRLDAGHRLLRQHRQEPLQLAAGQAHQAVVERLTRC